MNDSTVASRRLRAPARSGRKLVLHHVCVGVLAMAGFASHAGSVNYTYDPLGRLATVVYGNGTSTTTIAYSYDAAGNRTAVVTTTP